MRKRASVWAVVVGLMCLSVLAQVPPSDWRAPVRKARLTNPIASQKDSLAEGKELFMTACAPCHGESGRGNGPAASALERSPGNLTDGPHMWSQSDGELFWKISVGRSPMPTFEETFSVTQRWQIVNFIRGLAPKPKETNQATTSKTKTKVEP